MKDLDLLKDILIRHVQGVEGIAAVVLAERLVFTERERCANLVLSKGDHESLTTLAERIRRHD